jgi:alcohol dehydrogenase class IV
MAVNVTALSRDPGHAASWERFEVVARVLTNNPQASIQDGVNWVKSLVEDLGIPRLASYGIFPEHIPGIVEKSARASSMKANPVTLSADELSDALRRAL